MKIDILWPLKDAPNILETLFTYDFCRKMSKNICIKEVENCSWFNYKMDEKLDSILAKTYGDCFLLITNPEILLSSFGVIRLVKSLEENNLYAIGPVYNETSAKNQMADIPAIYFNFSTYLEISELIAKKEDNLDKNIKWLHPDCILFKRNIFEKIVQENPITLVSECTTSDALAYANGSIAVDKSAMIHNFGDYYGSQRDDLVNLIPGSVKKILDVGCAMGGYGKKVKELRPDIEIVGVEINSLMAKNASKIYNKIYTSSVESINTFNDFDLINCGDVIEHLLDPWQTFNKFYELLKPSGYLVLSIPNAAHWSIVKDLAIGNFQYIPFGLLCISHIRWFTESTIKEALLEAKFKIEFFKCQKQVPTPMGQKFINTLCKEDLGNRKSLETNEFLIRAVKL